jgi:hypothetical protein
MTEHNKEEVTSCNLADGWYKMNFDGVAKGNLVRAGGGGVIRVYIGK